VAGVEVWLHPLLISAFNADGCSAWR
jgi:hypothetical protein